MKPTKPIDLIESLPMTDLVRIHNTLTANTVKKFENRTKAARRINDLLKCQKLWFEQAAAAAGVITTEEAEARIKEIQETEAKLADDGWGEPLPPGSKGRAAKLPIVKVTWRPDAQDESQDIVTGGHLPTAAPAPAAWERDDGLLDISTRRENPDPTDPIHEDEPTEQEQQAEQTRQEAEDEPGEDEHLAELVTNAERREAEQAQADRKPPQPLLTYLMVQVTTQECTDLGNKIATLLRRPVTIMDGRTQHTLEVIEPPAKKAAARENGMTVNQRKIIELCERPEGATGKELAEGCGWPSIAARATCQKLADRFGYTLTEKPKTAGRGISFYLTPET